MAKKLDLSSYKRTSDSKKDSPRSDTRKSVIPEKYAKKSKPVGRSRSSTGSRSEVRRKTETKTKSKGKSAKATNDPANGIRLNRYIAHCGVCSRREADELIAAGRIRVKKSLVTEMGFKVMPGDAVFMGKKLLKREDYAYVLLNKPKDFITNFLVQGK